MNRIIPKFTHEEIEYIRYLIDENPCAALPGYGNFAHSDLPDAVDQMERDLVTTSSLDVIRSGKKLLKITHFPDIEKIKLYEKLKGENFRNCLLYSVYVDNKLYDYSLVEILREMNEEDLNLEIISIENEIRILRYTASFWGRHERGDKIEDLEKKIKTYLFMKKFNKNANRIKNELEILEPEIKEMEVYKYC